MRRVLKIGADFTYWRRNVHDHIKELQTLQQKNTCRVLRDVMQPDESMM